MDKNTKTLEDINNIDSLIAGINFYNLNKESSTIFFDKNGYDMNDFSLGQKMGKKIMEAPSSLIKKQSTKSKCK